MLARRKLMTGLAGLPIAAILADPRLAAYAAEATEAVSITSKDAESVSGAIALPAEQPAPAVLLIHEWWGLNDQIKSMAAEFAKEGYVALAVDLFGGSVAASPEEAQALTQSVDASKATDTLVSWVEWLRANPAVNGKVATVGWCFGGGWAINAAIATPVEATVIYYGRVPQSADEVKTVSGPVLGHFAEQDRFIDRPMVGGFEKAMKEAGKPLTLYWYDADHAFANPTGANYDGADAQAAWSRTLEFLKQALG
ncbi:MAG TPA: dienelactone hydrolase family protein [Alphaproteobacteria bacterium]|nr:dienelactone hydrolase family protein [Alphaproteobacteria bacterium]